MTQPLASVPEREVARRFDGVRRWWRPTCAAAFFVVILPMVPGRLPLPGGESLGFKSLARNVAVAVLLGALVRVDGLRLVRSRLVAPLLSFAVVAWASVAFNRGLVGDARLLVVVIGVFYAARLLAEAPGGGELLLHWLGAFAVATVGAEIASNPALLLFDPMQRTELRFAHPNSLGGSLAILLPLFAAVVWSGRRRGWAMLYAAAAVAGIAVSFSRSALLSSVLGLVVLGVGRRGASSGRRWRLLGLIVAAAFVAAYLSLGRGEADSQRLRILSASVSLFDEHRLLGIGYGIENLRRLFPPRYLELYGHSLFLFHSHNLYVEALVGTGVVGAIFFAWLLVRVVSVARTARSRAATAEQATLAAGLVASVAAFLVLGLTDSLMYQAQTMTAVAVLWALMDRAAAGQGGGKSTDQP
jgi:O-Antigen ligase